MIGKKFLAFSLSAVILAGSAMSASAAGVKDVFDANTYAGKYSDLKTAYGTDAAKLMEHFKAFGAKEGRVMSPILDVVAYRNAYADLSAIYGDNWDAYVDHYLTIGIKEKRTAGVLFDLVDYANKNADVKAAFGEDYAAIAQHYINYGIKEGRSGGVIATAAPAASSSSSSSATQTPAASAQTPAAPAQPATPAHKHYMNEVIDRKEPSCKEAGYETKRCTQQVQIGDNWVQCSYTETTTLSAKHTMPDDTVWLVCADCVNPGEVHYVCTVCGKYQEETVKALGHTKGVKVDSKSVASTCTKAGYDVYKCTRCGYEYQEAAPLEPHKIAEWVTVKPATCSVEGVREAYCSLCGNKFTENVARIDHQKEKDVEVRLDAYTTNVDSILAHTYQLVTYCEDCGYVTWASDLSIRACEDDDNDSKCDFCHLDMNRGRANSIKVYKVGEKFDINNIQ